MSNSSSRRRLGALLALLVVASFAVGGTSAAKPTADDTSAADTQITVKFRDIVRPIDRAAFSIDITGYGSGVNITNSAEMRKMLGNGRYGLGRMELKYSEPGNPKSKIIAGGAGADTGPTGDQWVDAIRKLGAEPVLIVPFNAVDAANLVRHFNTGDNAVPVKRWIIGNEHPDVEEYSRTFNEIYDAMTAVDPNLVVAGPALAWPDANYLRRFLEISGDRVDVIDFHKYGAGKDDARCDDRLWAETPQWAEDINRFRALIKEVVPKRADEIAIQVGEMNTDWYTNDPPNCNNLGDGPIAYRNAAAIWAASAFGQVAAAGGYGMVYGDKNGPLGVLYEQARDGAEVNDRMPVYQGLGFFTGQQGTKLARFGSKLVSATSSNPNVEVYASRDPRVVVVINKSRTATDAVISVSTGRSATVHQKDNSTPGNALPKSLGKLPLKGHKIKVSLPGPSITQLAIHSTPMR